MKVLSVREHPEIMLPALKYMKQKWAWSKGMENIYDNCFVNCMQSGSKLPQWYILMDESKMIGCAGLLPNDFISRMDLFPWMSSLFIEEEYRGRAYGNLLISYVKKDAAKLGYKNLYLCTDHTGYYEHYGFTYIGDGYHPWDESSRIYQANLVTD